MIEQLHNEELDQVNGGYTRISLSVKNSFNTGGTKVEDIRVKADDSVVSISVGSSGGFVFI